MAIRKRKNRASPYQVYWNNPYTGKRESQSFETLAEARKHDSFIKHRLAHEKESFKPEQYENNTGSTVREIVTLYLASKNFERNNLKDYLSHLKPVVKALGSKEVSEIERRDIVKFISDSENSGVKNTTAHRRVSILRAALSWAFDAELIESNPLHGVKIPRGKYERIAPPSPAEIEALLRVAPPHIKRVIILGVSLGLRIGESELFSLQWKDIDMVNRLVRIWSAAKNLDRPYRDVPISDSLFLTLEEWWKEDSNLGLDHLITYKGKPVKAIKRAWRTSLEKAGIERRIRPYDLRHAFATYALDAGADLKAVADIMGHSGVNTVLAHYQHTKEALRRKAVESIPTAFQYVPTTCAQEGSEK